MKKTWKSSLPSSARTALTLLEVLAALLLLSTALVSFLAAQKRLIVQHKRATRVLQASQVADQLLSTWAAQGIDVPPDATGVIKDAPAYRWVTRTVSRKYRSDLGLDVVELVISSSDHTKPQHELLRLELVTPYVPAPQLTE